jgi:hypothetical protein
MRCTVLALVIAGCGEVHFVEPNPPRLFRTKVQFTSGAVDEPLVWMAVLNLFLEEAADCAWAKDQTLSALRAAFAGAGGAQLELAAQDLSTDCRQRSQSLDVNAIQAAFTAARLAFPSAHVRPLIVYVDDIDLAVARPLAIDLTSLRRLQDGGGGPLLWAVSFRTVSDQLMPNRAAEWGYAGDPSLRDRVAALVSADLPLRSTATMTSGPVPLLERGELDATREFKVCAVPAEAIAGTYPEPGATQVLDRAHPPTIIFSVPQRVALEKSAFQTVSLEASVEGCRANCDRYFIGEPGGDPYRWDQMRGCALGNR